MSENSFPDWSMPVSSQVEKVKARLAETAFTPLAVTAYDEYAAHVRDQLAAAGIPRDRAMEETWAIAVLLGARLQHDLAVPVDVVAAWIVAMWKAAFVE